MKLVYSEKPKLRVSLNPLQEVHKNNYRIWRNNHDIYRWCRQYRKISEHEHNEWWEKLKTDKTINMFEIAHIEKNIVIGVGGLTSIDLRNRNAEFSLYIIKEWRGKGLAMEALLALIEYGFYTLGLWQIWGEVIEGNPALSLFVRLGFKVTGVRKQFYYKDGRYLDAHYISLNANEFIAKCKELSNGSTVRDDKASGSGDTGNCTKTTI